MGDIYVHHLDILAGDIVVWEHQIYLVLNISEVNGGPEYRLMYPHQKFEKRDELLVVSSVGCPDLKFRLVQSSTMHQDSIEALGGK